MSVRVRHGASLRVRMMVLMFAGILAAGVGFEVLLVTLTRQWLFQETEHRTRSLAAQLATHGVTPLLLADSLTLADEARRREQETDLMGIAFCDAAGMVVASSADREGLWSQLGPLVKAAPTDAARRHRLGRTRLLEIASPVVRRVAPVASPEEAAEQLLDLERATPRLRRETIGWVRVVVNLERIEEAIDTAARMGIMVLLVALLLGMLAASLLLRVVVRPLREAGVLAREIASGQLESRLPVRSQDELGALATSLNTMAAGLLEARQHAEAEAHALRVAAEAMVELARAARDSREPARVFEVVAREVRRVTGCDGIALAVPEGDAGIPVFREISPALPWGELAELPVLDGATAAGSTETTPDRIVLARETDPLGRALASQGYATALRVPLPLDGGPPALLLLVSRRAAAFPPGESEVVGGLTSHLAAALHAARLEERLRDAFGELQRTHDYLVKSEMLRFAGEMSSGVAHEFNNVLGAILGRAQILSLRSASGDLTREELIEALSVIERAALDGRETGRRLRQFGRMPEGEALEPVDLDRAVRDAVEFTRPRWENEAQAVGRHLEISVGSRPGAYVRARGHEMREVFTNLILNAVDALPDGGRITLGVGIEGGRVIATVEDDGIGMPAETRQRLFEPFFSTKGPAGTGLGLSLVYGIVQRCEGAIEVDSEPGRGTRIVLSFPAVEAAPARQDEKPADEQAASERHLAVLVVDDDPSVRDVLRDMVSILGHDVVACTSAPEALEQFAPRRYDLVLTDLGMPGVTGWSLTETIRQLDPDVVIAFVTGWGEEVHADQVRAVGADLVITKPFSIEDILRALQLVCAREEARNAA